VPGVSRAWGVPGTWQALGHGELGERAGVGDAYNDVDKEEDGKTSHILRSTLPFEQTTAKRANVSKQ
jgi:hypothetical protein